MCGIFGALSNNNKISKDDVHLALKAMNHRGPDGFDTWYSKSSHVCLGHVRLSIIDLSGGKQPISNEDNSCHIVVNGEFYDFEKIRTALKLKNHTFKTGSDSEILLHLYEEYGTGCLEYLRGEFAFVLWDEKNKILFAARDRFGTKPLYYTIHNNSLILASEIKSLTAFGVPAVLDEEYCHENMMTGISSTQRTFIKNIFQVPPAHFVVATESNFNCVRYWDLDFNKKFVGLSDQEMIEGFRTVMEDSVRTRLRADVPVAVYLSGGLDSCSVLALASKFSSNKLTAFSLAFDHEIYNEEPIAREMAQKVSADFRAVPITQDMIADNFFNAVYSSESTAINAHMVGKYILSKKVRESGFKVVLTGEGADEILLGYPHFRQDLFGQLAGKDDELYEMLSNKLNNTNKAGQGFMLPSGSLLSLNAVQSSLGFIPTFLATGASNGYKMKGLLHSEFNEKWSARDTFRVLLNNYPLTAFKGWEPANISSYIWAKTQLATYVFNNLGDKMEMANSIEGRLPFLDHNVAEYCFKLPMNMKINGLTEKFILRESMKSDLTHTVYKRQKHPFTTPPAALNTKGKLFQLMSDTIRSKKFTDMNIFDSRLVVKKVEDMQKASQDETIAWDSTFILLMSVYGLFEKFGMARE